MKKFILICLSVALLVSSCKNARNEFSNTIHIELPAEAVDIKEISET
jgi:hypothetical protein